MSNPRATPHRRRAIQVFHEAARQVDEGAEVHSITWLGEGLSRRTWSCTVDKTDGSTARWVAQVPCGTLSAVDRERFEREFALLGALSALELPFRSAAPVVRLEDDESPMFVTTFCPGRPLDMKGRSVPADYAATVVARLAAMVHALPTGLPCPGRQAESPRDDSLAALEQLRQLDAPFVDEALAWCEQHLPDTDAPATFVHGDLLGQNILLAGAEPPALVDWEYAGTGDPAADLAVVTRGARQVFGSSSGTQRLLDCYNEHAQRPLAPSALHLRELTLVAGEVGHFVQQHPASGDSELGRLRNLFARVSE